MNETYTQSGTESLLERLRRATIGRYDVYAEVGSGGMASVFLALDLALDRKVAIKVMSPALATSADNIERFKREAKVAASLNHPNIIGILAVGDDPELAYFVMKYVEGRSLESVIKESGPQSVPFVQTIIGSSGRALNYAHSRGVIHRDVKPANFMLDRDGWLIVTDFGIAKMEDMKGLTMTGSVIGTPYYMSPEQFHGKAVTGAADQYSLGVVAYECLTGKHPFPGDTLAEVMRGHLFDDVPSVRAVRNDVPEGIDACVKRMLAKAPADRFPTLDDAVMAFGSVSPSVEVQVRTQIISLAKVGMEHQPRMSVPVSPVPAQRPRPAAAKTKPGSAAARAAASEDLEETPPARSTRRTVLVALVLLIVGAGGGTAWLRPDLVASFRASLAGTVAGTTAADAARDQAVLDSVERERVATLARADSIVREDSIARVTAVADSLARVDSIARAVAAAAAARARPASRTAAAPPRALPAPAAVTPAVTAPPVATVPTAASTASATKDGASSAVRAAQEGPIPVAGQRPPPVTPEPVTPPPSAPATPTGPGTIRIGSRIPLAVLYFGDEIRPIGEQGIQTLTFPAGSVRMSIRAENCATWDTTFTVVAGQTHTIGFRPSRC